MKFTLQTITQCTGRLGSIAEIERLPGFLMETPMVLINTKGGVVPHLTHETLQMITKERQTLCLPVASSLQCLHATSELNKPLADFIGMKEYLTFCGLHDAASPLPQGYNGKGHVSVWTKGGRESLDADRYMDIMETFQPDFYQTLCDGDTDQNSTKKRIRRSIDCTYEFVKTCLDRHQKSKSLRHSGVLAVLEGGYSLDARGSAARMLAKVPVQGFVLDGLSASGAAGEKLNMELIGPLVLESLRFLPEEKLRMAPGCWRPEAVWRLVQLGVDMFDSALPTVVTDRGCALTFLFDPDTASFSYNSSSAHTSESSDDASNRAEQSGNSKSEEIEGLMDYEISLRDPKYRDRLEPLVEGCECLTCRSHTKAYVHHLLMTQELLAPVLLMIHNLHHYLEFFKSIRQAIQKSSSKSPQ